MIPNELKYNVVYCIPCSNYSKIYISQTYRELKLRIISHKSECCNINKRNAYALITHYNYTKHEIDFTKAKILEIEIFIPLF